jgi:hypothetical protein
VTFAQTPRGENRRAEHRAAALVDHAKPTHLLFILEYYMFFCIHLPGIVGRGRPLGLGFGPPPRRRRGEVRPHEPAPERAVARDRPPRGFVEQLRADPFGPPRRVPATELKGGVDNVRWRGADGRVAIARRDARRAVAAKPLDQSVNRREWDSQNRGDLGSPLPLLPEPEDGVTDRSRDGTRHGGTSGVRAAEEAVWSVYPCSGILKPGVRISFSNWVSGDTEGVPRKGKPWRR